MNNLEKGKLLKEERQAASYQEWLITEAARHEREKAWAKWHTEARAAYEIEQRKRGREIDWRDDWFVNRVVPTPTDKDTQ